MFDHWLLLKSFLHFPFGTTLDRLIRKPLHVCVSSFDINKKFKFPKNGNMFLVQPRLTLKVQLTPSSLPMWAQTCLYLISSLQACLVWVINFLSHCLDVWNAIKLDISIKFQVSVHCASMGWPKRWLAYLGGFSKLRPPLVWNFYFLALGLLCT